MAAAGEDDLTVKQHAAIAALLSRKTVAAAAKAAGVAPSTLHEWLKEPAFKARFREARQELLDTALAGLNGLTRDAIAALKRNLTAKGNPGAQVRAAVAILDKAINAQALADLAAEVAVLRAELERGTNGDAGGTEPGNRPDPGGVPKPKVRGDADPNAV